MKKASEQRELLTTAKRIVIKAGSKVLVQRNGQPDTRRLRALTSEITQFHHRGGESAFVTSGAIGAGRHALGMKTRPKSMPDLQMTAAVGQMRLMGIYDGLFRENNCLIGQVLLTHDVLRHRERHLNARNTLLNLIAHRIIPVINENDTISTEEIKFGDNDVLAALVAILIDADALILLSTTDGLREPDHHGKTRRVSQIEEVNEEILSLVTDKQDALSSGGMASKLKSAQLAATNGIPVVIANGRKNGVLDRILHGKDEGTLLVPHRRNLSKRKRWIAFFNKVEGRIIIDPGAVEALEHGKSLLPVGVQTIEGNFPVGALIDVRNNANQIIARGLTEFSSAELEPMIGHKHTDKTSEVIHRNNMVML